ncbi:MAG TPA: XRE family transcriptional regulator, partial [Candidatus Baltobacteraceae bacterium]|nr:XRE family transcriptional regulator [Candidatus Baltobacteraceae bacterium]
LFACSLRKNQAGKLKKKKSAVPDAIEESLRPFAIAEKLRGLRLKKSMGLAQLAQHTGLSPAMLSRLENGRLVPTLPTLARIALVFDVGLDYFFNDPRKRHVVAIARRQERRKFPADPQSPGAPWHFESLDFRARDRRFNGFLAHFHPVPRARLIPHFHPGAELLYLIEGELELSIGVETICLSAGDSIYFDSIQKHAYRNAGAGPCTAVVVTSRQLS